MNYNKNCIYILILIISISLNFKHELNVDNVVKMQKIIYFLYISE